MGIAIVGTGWGARVQVPAFRSAGLEVVALAGSDAAKTRRIAAELGVTRGEGDWRVLLAQPDIDLISVVTPPHLHAEIAEAALGAGKHVLCEKPTALNAAEAQRMVAAAAAHPALLAIIDHELRFLPGLRLARQMIAAGEIGELRHARHIFHGHGRSDPTRAWDWWSDADQGGGAMGAIGSHQIDTLRYLTSHEVRAVAGTLRTFVDQRPTAAGPPRRVTSDDFYSLRLLLGGSALATIEGSVALRTPEPTATTLFGSQGTLRWQGGRLFLGRPGQEPQDITPPHPHAPVAGLSDDFAHATVYLAHALRRFLQGDQEAMVPAATFADGLRVQLALDAARRSNTTDGGMVALDPA